VSRSGAGLADTIVVLGCGPVGLMALLCLSGFGGGAIAVDSIEARRSLAASFGAEAVSPGEASELVLARTGGLGADVVIEAAGTPGALGRRGSGRGGRGLGRRAGCRW
jgi:threonine dehydrogenase-like Zn-dependent dehydrogenase